MTHLINQSISDKGVCRTAPATPGLINISAKVRDGPLGLEFFFVFINQEGHQHCIIGSKVTAVFVELV